MGFTAECIPNVGLEFYISQIEALIAPDFVSGFSGIGKEAKGLIDLRKQIWEHIRQGFITTSGSTRDEAIENARELANQKGYTIADIVSIDTEEAEEEYQVQRPLQNLDLLKKAQEKTKGIFGVSGLVNRVVDWYKARHEIKVRTKTVKKKKVTARLYSSDFLEGEGKDPVGEVLAYLGGEKPKESDDKFYEALMKRVREAADKGNGTGITLLDKELERKKGEKLDEIVGEKYNPRNFEHVTKVLEKFYYPRLVELGKFKDVKAEIRKLEQDIRKLEKEQEEEPLMILPDSNKDSYDTDKHAGREKKLETKRVKLEEIRKKYDGEFKSKIDIAKKQLDFLLGQNANPLRSDGYDIMDDYRRQNDTEKSVRQKLAPLYVNFHLTDKGIVRKDDGELSDREFRIVAQSMGYFKQRRMMSQKGFADLIEHILHAIQQEYLTPIGTKAYGERFRHYSRIIEELGDRDKTTKTMQLKQNNLFDYLINATLKYYLRGEITQQEAANSLLKLRYDEIAQKVFDDNFTEYTRQLKEAQEKGRREGPQMQEQSDVLDVTIEKLHCLLRNKDGQPFESAIETKYKKAANGVQRLAKDYHEMFVTRKPKTPDSMEIELRYGIAPKHVVENYYALVAQANQGKKPVGKAFGG